MITPTQETAETGLTINIWLWDWHIIYSRAHYLNEDSSWNRFCSLTGTNTSLGVEKTYFANVLGRAKNSYCSNWHSRGFAQNIKHERQGEHDYSTCTSTRKLFFYLPEFEDSSFQGKKGLLKEYCMRWNATFTCASSYA